MDQLCGEGFGELDLRQVIARARAAMLASCKQPDDDFLAWLWGLTGETPPPEEQAERPPAEE